MLGKNRPDTVLRWNLRADSVGFASKEFQIPRLKIWTGWLLE